MKSNSLRTLKNSPNPVTLQCTYHDRTGMPEFLNLLDQLSRSGFYGIELNLPDLQALPAKKLHSLLDDYGLRLTYLATGAFARSRDLSLSSPDAAVRRRSVEGCMENIRYAGDFGAGIIIGYLKNHPQSDRENAALYLKDSLAQLDDFAKGQNIPILLEATNRYESCVANSLYDTLQITRLTGGTMISILPDTYHMNIEESHPLEALDYCRGCYRNIHLSDNNRYFPGFGCLDFEVYLKKLKAIHYQGTFGIEGNLKNGILKDLELCVNYLSSVMESMDRTEEAG